MKSMLAKIIKIVNHIVPIEGVIFYFKIRKYKYVKKIIYTITPPYYMKNMGDQAQAIGIHKWFKDNFKDYIVVEFDKGEIYNYIAYIQKIVNKQDLIFLHSGGNLGDRGIWSETLRRLVIKSFPDNKIISLPQTIFFSDTEEGRRELEITKELYNCAKNLTIIARDEYSLQLAKDHFPKCKTLACPDFVLYLKPENNTKYERRNILVNLRNDNESCTDEDTKNAIKNYVKSIDKEYHEFDTDFDGYIPREERENELNKMLSIFQKHKLVITDRLHGTIFSVITQTPCIAMKSIDHKVRETVKWFIDLNYVVYTEDPTQLPELIDKMIKLDHFDQKNFRELYFDKLKSRILSGEPS